MNIRLNPLFVAAAVSLAAPMFVVPTEVEAAEKKELKELTMTAMRYVADTTSMTPLTKYSCGTALIEHIELEHSIDWCMLANPSRKSIYAGFVDFSDARSPRLVKGMIMNLTGGTGTEVTCDYGLDLDTSHPLQQPRPSGAYDFTNLLPMCNQGWIERAAPASRSPHASDGTVGYMKTGLGAEPESLSLYQELVFTGAGGGQAVQVGQADGSQEFIGAEKHRGANGHYYDKTGGTTGIEYHVDVRRPSAMTYTFDPSAGKLSVIYGAKATPTVKFSNVRGRSSFLGSFRTLYTGWANTVPSPFCKGETAEFNVVGVLRDFIVIDTGIDDPDNPLYRYFFAPRASMTYSLFIPDLQITVTGKLTPSPLLHVNNNELYTDYLR